MSYERNFSMADQVVLHLGTVVDQIQDPLLASKYVGFVAISAVTVYELAIKDIFISFCEKKHNVFGAFARSHFGRINGRIASKYITSEYLPRFGEKYKKRFCKKRDMLEKQFLRSDRVSILSSYNNVVNLRNQFAHEGVIPSTMTFEEMTRSYKFGKHIIHCLASTMIR